MGHDQESVTASGYWKRERLVIDTEGAWAHVECTAEIKQSRRSPAQDERRDVGMAAEGWQRQPWRRISARGAESAAQVPCGQRDVSGWPPRVFFSQDQTVNRK